MKITYQEIQSMRMRFQRELLKPSRKRARRRPKPKDPRQLSLFGDNSELSTDRTFEIGSEK